MADSLVGRWRRLPLVCLALAVVVALGLRVHALSRGYFDIIDEGVYWESLRSASQGHALFSSVYSSQPPAFLQTELVAFSAFGHSLVAARAGILLWSLVLIGAAFVTGRLLLGSLAAAGAALAAGVDPLVSRQAVTLQAEMPCIALGMVAMACILMAHRFDFRRGAWLVLIAGVLLAASLMTKFLAVAFFVPAAMCVIWPPVTSNWARNRSLWALLLCGLGGLLGTAVWLAPYSGHLPALFQQTIGLHLSGGAAATAWTLQVFGIWIRDELPLILVAAAGLLLIGLRHRNLRLTLLLVAWIAAAAIVDVEQRPLWPHHLAILTPPLLIAAGAGFSGAVTRTLTMARSHAIAKRLWLAAPMLAVLAAGCLSARFTFGSVTENPPPDYRTSGADAIAADTNAGPPVISDDSYAVALANRDMPPQLVDTSEARIRAGQLTSLQVERIAIADHVDAILFAYGNLENLPGFKQWVVAHYPVEIVVGPTRTLYLLTAPGSTTTRG